MQALSSSATHPLIIIMFSVQAHDWMVVEKEWGAAVARLICQMIDDSKLRDCQVTNCLLHFPCCHHASDDRGGTGGVSVRLARAKYRRISSAS